MLSVPPRVTTDGVELHDERRFDISVTLLMGGYDQAELEEDVPNWGPYRPEYEGIRDRRVMRIGSAHWPQFTAPARLGQLILEAVDA